MNKILINIKDKSKAYIVVSLLKELSFLEFRELVKVSKTGKASDFRKLFGIWKGREITLAAAFELTFRLFRVMAILILMKQDVLEKK
ncbi:MAG: hypothetical protein KAI50_02315 [Desulfobacterales bacterium]|nr:hypothetical protein [Desulfobacterales bacterium]